MNQDLTFDELLEFIKWENGRVIERDGFVSKREDILSGVVKLSEELGELSNEILINLGLCRPDKFRENKKEMDKEVIDCLLVLLILAERMGVDVKQGLKDKMEIIKNRKY